MRRLDLAVILVIGAAGAALALNARPSIASDAHTSAAERIGVVDILSLVEQTLQQPEYATIREQTADDLTENINQIQAQLAALSEELNTLPPGDPRGQEVFNQLQNQRMVAQNFQEQSLANFQRLSAAQAAEAYSLVRDAADQVAAREGYSFVIATRAGRDLSASVSLPAVTQEVLARPVIVGMEENDLTEMVRIELGLPDPAAAPAADDAGGEQPAGDGGAAQASPEGESAADDAPADEGGESP